jgi:uncharacterized protein
MIATKGFRLACAAALVIGWCGLTGAARAQPTASAIAVAKELVEIKGGNNMFDPVIINVIDQTRTALLRTSPQLSKDLNDVATALVNEFASKRADLIAEAAKFYANRFSEQELKDLVTFYKSPLGKKMLAQEPLVLDETFNFVQAWAPKVSEEVMVRFRAEMKKKGHNL